MNDIIGQITSQLGISSDVATSGAGALMGMLKSKADSGTFSALAGAVPEINDWMTKSKSSGDAGLAGGLLGQAASMLGGGGNLGGMAAVVGMLGKSGMDSGIASKFVPLLLSLVKAKAGDAVFGQLVKSVPFVAEVLGGKAGTAGQAAGVLSSLGKMFGK